MIIKIGKTNLLPWINWSTTQEDSWIRAEEYGSANQIKLVYDKFGGCWYPNFGGNLHYLKAIFETHFELRKYKFKQHEMAMLEFDSILVRMVKLTIFL